jgi:hypothetical protein
VLNRDGCDLAPGRRNALSPRGPAGDQHGCATDARPSVSLHGRTTSGMHCFLRTAAISGSRPYANHIVRFYRESAASLCSAFSLTGKSAA